MSNLLLRNFWTELTKTESNRAKREFLELVQSGTIWAEALSLAQLRIRVKEDAGANSI